MAQLLSLISYGNEYIVTGRHQPGFYPGHSVFRHCHSVSFEGYKTSLFTSPRKINAGNDPKEWFSFLKQRDCRELRLLYRPSQSDENFKDYQTAGLIGGGGTWLIEAVYQKTSDFWYAHWKVPDPNSQRPWEVKYEVVASQQSSVNAQIILYQAKESLHRSLQAIYDFTRGKEELTTWRNQFHNAMLALDSENPEADFYHADLIITAHYSLTARQLIFGAAKSWVFGAMGSWNDQGFPEKEDQAAYEKATETLYKAAIIALIAGINTY